jgi:hypothetical protein
MDFLDQTIEVWQPYSERPLSREDAREIAHNVTGFFRLLREWAEEERTAATAGASASDTDGTSDPQSQAASQGTRRGKTAAERLARVAKMIAS